MFRSWNRSIAAQVTRVNMLVSGAALAVACAALFGYGHITFRNMISQQLSTQAQILATSTVSALLFDDPAAAEKTLSALSALPRILSAGIRTKDGRLFAEYRRDPNLQPPVAPSITLGQIEIESRSGSTTILVRRIVSDGDLLGTVYIQSDLREVDDRLRTYGSIVGLVLAVSLLAALFASRSFQKIVSEPIQGLAETARSVSRDKNYCLRAASRTGANEVKEVRVLIRAFNDMLAQIQDRDEALRRGRDELEERVKARTAELETAKREIEEFSHSMLRAKEEVERASKFKDQFLSTMSHELRTPLNAVLGFSDLLQDQRYGPLNDRQARYINHIHTGGKHLLRLINDILDLSKIEAGRLELHPETVPVKSAFTEVLDTLRTLADQKEQVLSQFTEDDLRVRADSTRFKQILMNLVGNAIKFTPEGGRVELHAYRRRDQAVIEVRDSGPGIPAEEQQRIFDPFYRLRQSERSAEGTGLGLAITRRLVELHGSELALDSESGAGSCFYFALPAAAGTPAPPAREPEALQASGQQTRVLVIEDDLAAAQLIELHLVSLGYEVVLCNKPEGAQEMAFRTAPDAITLDLLMAPVTGWEVLAQLRSNPRTAMIPIIVISIADQPGSGTILGADEYLVKPVDRSTLLAAIERCLRTKHRLQNQTILVVEDDEAAREVIAEVLTSQGYAVVAAADGTEARARVEDCVPHAIILDLLLPGVSGFELLGDWRADPRTAKVPVFVLTSKDLSRDEEAYLRANAECLFCKQQRWQEALTVQVQRVLKTSQMQNA